MASQELTWNDVREAIDFAIKRCCCASQDVTHDRFDTLNEHKTPQTIYSYNNTYITFEDDFIYEALNKPELEWIPKFGLHDVTQGTHPGTDWDLGDGSSLALYYPQDRFQRLSTSTKESGYGRSIKDSVNLTATVVRGSSRYFYKVQVKRNSSRWSLYRTPSEFYQLQKQITNKVGKISSRLPPQDRLSARDLDSYTQTIMGTGKALKLSEVRAFFQLESKSTSTRGSTDSDPSSPTVDKKSDFVLDPNKLMGVQVAHKPPMHGTPASHAPASKPMNVVGASGPSISTQLLTVPKHSPRKMASTEDVASVHTKRESLINGVGLGCEEKKMSPEDFIFLSVIGKGSFGRVMLAKRRDNNKSYAVKILNKKMILKRNETAHVLSERSVLIRVLKHPYVVQLHYAFTTPTKIYFVLDYINGGELFFHLQKEKIFSEKRSQFYAAEICCAICYMHKMGIIYRDLKPENILLDKEGHIVLTDFGLCKEGLDSGTSRTATFCGTPEYLAPEIILKKPYTRSVDWWTLGAVLYEMLYGLPPFYSKDTPAMYDAILHKPLKLRHTVSPKARSVLNSLLQKNHRMRLGSRGADGEEVKRHSFFEDIDWRSVEERKVKPPFVPRVANDLDTSNIDPLFTREPVASPSVSPSGGYLSSSFQDSDSAFRGFSYAPSSELTISR